MRSLILFVVILLSCDKSNDQSKVTLPLPPSNLIATANSTNQISLSWTDNSTNEDGFKIERKTSTGVYSAIGTVSPDLTSYIDTGLLPDSYTYRIYSFNSAGKSLTYSNEVTVTTLMLPALTTDEVSSIGSNSALCGGNIISDGGSQITLRGLVWGTSQLPTRENASFTTNGTGLGLFTGSLTNLTSNTKYFVRAYATNSVGTSYGNEVTFISSLDIKDVQLLKLAKLWKVASVSLDGTDRTSDYSNFQIIFSGTSGQSSFGYITTGRPALSPWKPSGACQFGLSVETQMIRDSGTPDELSMTYAVTASTLQLTFTYSGAGYSSRTESVKGQWVFNLRN